MSKHYGTLRPIRHSRKHKKKPSYISFRSGEQGWTVQRPEWNPSSQQLKALALVFIVIAGIFASDQAAKVFFPNSPLNPLQNYDPFTLLWNGTTTTPGSASSLSTILSQNSGGTDQGINVVSLAAGAFKFGECFTAPATTFVYSFSVALKRAGSPTGLITGVMRSGFNPLSPRNCEGGTGGLAGSGTSFDASTLGTSYALKSFDFSASPYAITSGSGYEIEVGWANCAGCDANNYVTVEIASNAVSTQNGYTFQPNAPDCANPAVPGSSTHCPTTYDLHFTISGSIACPSGYQCVRSGIDGSHNIQLTATGLSTSLDSFHPVINDFFGTGRGAAFASFYGESFTITGAPSQIASVQFMMNKTKPWTGAIVAQIWSIVGTPGVNALPAGTQPNSGKFPVGALSSSTAVTDSTVMPTNATAAIVTFTFPSSPVFAAGDYFVTLTENTTIASNALPLSASDTTPVLVVETMLRFVNPTAYAGHNSQRDMALTLIGNNLGTGQQQGFWFTITAVSISAVALTSSPIDVSTSSAKELLFYETWHNLTLITASQPWGWFLTTNKTLPTQPGYSPLNDTSVAFIDLIYPAGGASNTKNYYEYQAKTGSQSQNGAGSLLSQSGLATNPYPSCPQTSTLYICNSGTAVYSSQFQGIASVLNYTGTAGAGGNNGYSLFCVDGVPGPGSPTTNPYCSSTTQTPTVTPCTGTSQEICATPTLPFLNMQSGPYFLGFWSSAGQSGTIQFGTTNSGASDARANSVWYWVPNPTVATPATVDTGGFFGPVIKALLGIGVWIVANIVSFITFLASVVAPFLAATFGVLIAVLQAELNALGGFFGWGNIGDQFISFASGIVTYFTTGLSDALGWLIRLILRSIDLIKIANFWVNFYLGGLFNLLADGLNVIVFVVRIGTTITTFLGSSYVLILVMFFLWYDADMGIAGWHAWFETMKWFAFISFDFLERMINFGISSITWIIGRIPTMDGTTLPELPTIAIGGGPIWPSTDMTALREGNVFALFGQMIGVTFLVWFESSGLPGSIGANVPNSAASSMAPFVTMLLILVAIMGIVFVVSIPANMVRGTFSLDSLPSSVAGQARAGIISGGQGVSGRFVRKHPERKFKIVVHRGLGVGGLRPHLRKPQMAISNIKRYQKLEISKTSNGNIN